MVSIERLQQTVMPDVSRSGVDQASYTASWEIDTDAPTTADHALALAQGLAKPLPGSFLAIPLRGDVFAADEGICEPAVTKLGLAAWVGVDPDNRTGDGGAIQLEERCAPREEGWTKQFLATVTFRAPRPGQFELPRFLPKFDSLAASLPTPPVNPTLGTQVAEALADEPREINTDYVMKEFEQTQVYPVLLAGPFVVPGQERTPFRNTAGELYPPFVDVVRVQVAIVSMIVSDEVFAHQLNALFAKTMNNDILTFQGQTIPRYRAKFDWAETTKTISQGAEYKVLSYRIEIHPQTNPDPRISPLFRVQPSVGSYHLEERQIDPNTVGLFRVAPEDTDGNLIPGNVPLMIDGTLAKTDPVSGRVDGQHIDVVTNYRAVPYGKLIEGNV